jgi:short-subunit dehydrogenase
MSKVELITGCSTGIGRDLAQRLAHSGYTVAATARKVGTLEGLDVALKLPLDATRYGMQDVRIFRHAMSPIRVAQVGYRAMERGRPLVVAGFSNWLQALTFQLMAPFLGLTPPAWLMAVGRLFMGRRGSGRPQAQPTR